MLDLQLSAARQVKNTRSFLMSTTKRVALVTGASSGIGEAAANKLAAAGYKVYGTSRRVAPASHRTFSMLALDVTDDASVKNAVDELMRLEGRIDLLVNNAGFGLAPAAAEESSIDQVRALFDTNVLGVVRVSNAVLPVMRRQGSGRILNVGSGLGIIPAPYNVHYCATKHAIEGYSESLDHEVREFGVRVAVIEPGVTRTSFESSVTPADRPQSAYDESRKKYLVAYKKALLVADTAESVAETIVLAAKDNVPKLRYPSGKVAHQGAFARRFLPRGLVDKVLHKQFGLG
jgi:NAD(P)-dependent dehydrogenase (short-subunit alcohol dehydrogenase family)